MIVLSMAYSNGYRGEGEDGRETGTGWPSQPGKKAAGDEEGEVGSGIVLVCRLKECISVVVFCALDGLGG